MTKNTKHKLSFGKLIFRFWLLVVIILITTSSTFVLVSYDFFGALPSIEVLENPKSNLATEIFTADHKLLGKYFRENRTNIRYNELPQHLVNALIATEDERFRNHSGIDFRGLVRAVAFLGGRGGASTITQQLAKNLFPRDRLSFVGLIIRKFKEWVIAVRLERCYTKDEIITMYLNTFDFVNNAVGIKSAANVYFNVSPDSLSVEQAAMLVGMAQNPALYNPLRRIDTTFQRRNVVMYQMMRNGFLTQESYDSLKQLPIILDYKTVDHKEGVAPYFREILRAKLTKIFNEKDKKTGNYLFTKPNGEPYNIYSDGLKIYTTIDYRMQEYAEWAVSEHLGKELQKDFFRNLKKKKNNPFDSRVTKKQIYQIMNTAMKRTQRYSVIAGKECGNCGRRGKYIELIEENGQKFYQCNADDCGYKRHATPKDSIEMVFDTPVKMKVFTWKGERDTIMSPMDSIRYYKSFLQAGLMSIDPHTGYIKAWVGGINNKHFSYDHVIQSRRQVGSTFKPFVYAVAINEGKYSPCEEIPNTQVVFEKDRFHLLENWKPKNSDGLYGCNISLKYALANSVNTITAQLMKMFGPESVVKLARNMGITSPLDPVPSLCLGVADLTVFEMTGANAVFANKGIWIEPTFIARIEDNNGNVIFESQQKTREALSEEAAYVMLELMNGVVNGVYNKCLGDLRKSKGNSACYTCGTAMRIRGSQTKERPYAGIKVPMAGKTGTTQNNSDGWFMGITPDLVTGVWVGAEDRSVRFSDISHGQGANMALPIWGYYMNKIYKDNKIKISQGDFEKPEGGISIELDCIKYNQHKLGKEYDFDN